MDLSDVTIPAITRKRGTTGITINAGQSLKIETGPAGEELLDTEVPAGKVWKGTIKIDLVEEDA